METTPVLTLTGRVDAHRLDELEAAATSPIVDASRVDFLDHHALGKLEALGAVIAAPSDVVRITLELTGSTIPCFPSVGAAIARLVVMS